MSLPEPPGTTPSVSPLPEHTGTEPCCPCVASPRDEAQEAAGTRALFDEKMNE